MAEAGDRGTAPYGAMVRRIRDQARACAELGSPLYASLLDALATDVETGGPSAAVLAGHEDDPGPSALALRLMGAVHRLVLVGRAPALAAHYPSAGGRADDPAGAWAALRKLLAHERDELRSGLDRPPQTNEVGRAAVLVGGLLHLAAEHRQPVRLREIGASAGLNLRADAFRVVAADGTAVGPPDSPVRLTGAWQGRLPPGVDLPEVVDRLGCDSAPVDPTTEEGRLALTSYVWPDQVERLARLRGALDVAARVPARLVAASARDLAAGLDLREGTTTLLWHSVMWQYLDPAERADVLDSLERLGATATPGARLAHLSLEPRRRTPDAEHEFLVVLRTWPTGEERVLGSAAPHGLPTVWE